MINEAQILEAIKQHFQKNPEHVCRIISSNFSQNWLATEAQIALNWADNNCLQPDEHVFISMESIDDEQGKMADIVIVNDKKKIVGKIEFDLYDPNNPKKTEESIKEFKRRLDQHIYHRQTTNQSFAIIGILFAIWKVKLPAGNSLNQETAFYIDLSAKLRKYFNGSKFDSYTKFLPETIISNTEVDWGYNKWDSSLLAATIVSLLPEAKEEEENTLSWIDDLADKDSTVSIPSEKQIVNSDMAQARNVQKKMLKDAPQVEGFQIASKYESCDEVTGDFFEFIQLPEGKIGFAQGDVSGHGVQAGLVMSMAKKILAMNARHGQGPSDVLSSVNEELIHDLNGKTFVSMTYGILDTLHKKISWARAGHNPSILYNIHTKELRSLKPPGMVVGLRDTFLFRNTLREEEITLTSGDIFLVYTDGLTETANRQGEPFRQERLEDVIKAWGHLDVNVLLDRIMDSARSFRGGGPITDDITLVVIKVD